MMWQGVADWIHGVTLGYADDQPSILPHLGTICRLLPVRLSAPHLEGDPHAICPLEYHDTRTVSI